MAEVACRWTSSTTPRVVPGRHEEGCAWSDPEHVAAQGEPRCAGCQVCTEPHCAVCHRNHDETICPYCVRDTRDTLREIADLTAALPDQAVNGGGDGHLLAAAPIPGGDALVMLGPSADVAPDVLSDPIPPLLVLGTWEDAWRDILQRAAGPKATVWNAVDWLSENLYEMAHGPYANADVFSEMAKDLRALRGRLEAVLGAGDRDHVGVGCLNPDCDGDLRQQYFTPQPCTHDHAGRRHLAALATYSIPVWRSDVKAALAPCGDTFCDQGGRRSVWSCPKCRRMYSEQDYRRAVAQSHAEARPIRAGVEIAQMLSIPAARVRLWASRGLIERRGKDERGRMTYDIAEVRIVAMRGGVAS